MVEIEMPGRSALGENTKRGRKKNKAGEAGVGLRLGKNWLDKIEANF